MAGLVHAAVVALALPARGEEAPAVQEFLLEAADGARVSLQAPVRGRTLTVLAFLGVHCETFGQLGRSLGVLERDVRGRGVRFLGIVSDAKASREAITAFANEYEVGFPLLRDPFGTVAEQAGVEHDGEVLLLDGEFRVVYRGAFDDRFEPSAGAWTSKPSRANNEYLFDAIESTLAGETLDPDRVECGGPELPVAKPEVTFHRDVAPILFTHCASCHRPGQVGPMALLDVDDATGWAPQIAEVVGQGRMPPWHADPRHGRFKNERRLTETEKRTLAAWAESGAKPGDPKEAPPTPVFADPEWTIGPPDLVLELPEEQPIQAEGVLNYRYVHLDPGFTEEHWVQAVEVRPSARAATHHVIAYLLPKGMSRKDALRDPATVLQLDALGGYAPGSTPMELPPGQATRIRAGSTILFELHYTPIGKALTDRTKVGVKFATGPVTHEVQTGAAMNFRFRIPPNKPDATFPARSPTFRKSGQLLTLTPHMHMRGRSFRYELERKDKSREILLDVPRYDFNWQHTYVLAEPIDVAAGDVLHVTAVYDNSKDNPFNPNPNVTVTWGDQTFEEMLIGYYDYVESRSAGE